MVLQRTFPTNIIVKDIFDQMIRNPTKSLTIGWTKAHVGNKGNERADLLAKEVTELDTSDIFDNLSFPISIVKRFCKMNMIGDWQSYWKNSKDGRETYGLFKKVDVNYLCTSQVQQYFITGHGSFPTFLFKIGKRPAANCDCGYHGDIKHFLFGNCPLVPYFFSFNNYYNVNQNIKRVVLNKDNYYKLCQIYNALNRH